MSLLKSHSYGNVWQHAINNMSEILSSRCTDEEKFQKILKLGYFSQLTSYASKTFNQELVTWFENFIFLNYRVRIEDLPDAITELDIIPEPTLVMMRGRKFSPDLLRNVAYVLQLQGVFKTFCNQRFNVLEIGSGYGALAHVTKIYHPGCSYWLTDIPESLRCAEIYLRKAFPTAKIAWITAENFSSIESADFYLVPMADALEVLCGIHFALVINIWSFGEMPNEFISAWFLIIQQACHVEWFFTINSFMAPITTETINRIKVGDWLFKLDEHWIIDWFEIDPEIHRSSHMRNFPKGIGFLAYRTFDSKLLTDIRKQVAMKAEYVYREDWAIIASDNKSMESPDRPERMFDDGEFDLQNRATSCHRLNCITDYIGHFNIDSDLNGPFFKLWSDWRLNKNSYSAMLLLAYLSMVGKSDLGRKCTKEELLILSRLDCESLSKEYASFLPFS